MSVGGRAIRRVTLGFFRFAPRVQKTFVRLLIALTSRLGKVWKRWNSDAAKWALRVAEHYRFTPRIALCFVALAARTRFRSWDRMTDSIRSLHHLAGVSRSTMEDALRTFEAWGLIAVDGRGERTPSPDGFLSPVVFYRLCGTPEFPLPGSVACARGGHDEDRGIWGDDRFGRENCLTCGFKYKTKPQVVTSRTGRNCEVGEEDQSQRQEPDGRLRSAEGATYVTRTRDAKRNEHKTAPPPEAAEEKPRRDVLEAARRLALEFLSRKPVPPEAKPKPAAARKSKGQPPTAPLSVLEAAPEVLAQLSPWQRHRALSVAVDVMRAERIGPNQTAARVAHWDRMTHDEDGDGEVRSPLGWMLHALSTAPYGCGGASCEDGWEWDSRTDSKGPACASCDRWGDDPEDPEECSNVSVITRTAAPGGRLPSPFADPALGTLPLATRMLYLGIRHLAGEGDEVLDSPHYLKGQVFPYDDGVSAMDVAEMVASLAAIGKVHRVDGHLLLSDPPKPKARSRAKTKGAAGGGVALSTGRSSELAVWGEDAPPLNPTAPFDLFWAAYPRRTGKGAARKAFLTQTANGADAAMVIATAERYGVRCRQLGKEPQFIPHPSTWLNQERWDDDEEAAPTVRSRTDDVLSQNLSLVAFYAEQEGIDPGNIGMPGGPWGVS